MLNNRSKLFVVLGVAQVGVIVEGTFCCASFVKHVRIWGAEDLYAYSFPFLFLDYGFLCLAIPALWTILAVYSSEQEDATWKSSLFFTLSGLAMVGYPAVAFLALALGPDATTQLSG